MNSERETIDHNWLPNAALFSKMKIVVIDDEPANIALLEAMLAEGGYTRIKTVTNSRLAMETCLEVEPDLVLLRDLTTTIEGELFALPNQSAQDVRRYDFIKDVARLEVLRRDDLQPVAQSSTDPGGRVV